MSERDAEAAIQPLRSLGGIRNLLLHTGKVGFAGAGDGFLHPKKADECINIEALEALIKRFDEDHVRASVMLAEWYEKLSPYLRKFKELEAQVMVRAGEEPPEDSGKG